MIEIYTTSFNLIIYVRIFTKIKCHGFYIEQGEMLPGMRPGYVHAPGSKYFLCFIFIRYFMIKNFKIILTGKNIYIII